VPEVLTQQLLGSVTELTGTLQTSTLTHVERKTYNSLTDTVTVDFSTVFPILRPEGVKVTTIRLDGTPIRTGMTYDIDSQEDWNIGELVIDWEAATLRGVFIATHGQNPGASLSARIVGSFAGATNEAPITIVGGRIDAYTPTNWQGGPIDPAAIFGTECILGLPLPPRSGLPHQFAVALIHYRSSDTSGIEPMFPTFPIVTTLPVTDQQPETVYVLPVADDFHLAPPGLYVWATNHWICLRSLAPYALPTWSADVVVAALIPGADYLVTVDNAEVTSVTLGLAGDGRAFLMGANVYGSTMPAGVVGCGSIGTTPFAGWAGSNPYWRVEVQQFNGIAYARAEELTLPA
jgi:hypothetical protein